jgi:hypothetical protein
VEERKRINRLSKRRIGLISCIWDGTKSHPFTVIRHPSYTLAKNAQSDQKHLPYTFGFWNWSGYNMILRISMRVQGLTSK